MESTTNIIEALGHKKPTLSFEFFPPKSAEASERLFATITELAQLKPSFVSVTYGAGGSSRERTHKLVLKIMGQTRIPAVPHLTCVNHSFGDIEEILSGYADAGIPAILALRGDLPGEDLSYNRSQDAFRYASDLVSFIHKFNRGIKTPQKGFGVGVAGFPEGHPDTQNRLKEMDHLRKKVDAGADYICTQLFFNNYSFLDFRDRCRLAGINVPIIAGIMPITTRSGMERMADLAAGVHFPAQLQRMLRSANDDSAAFERAGSDFATTQCRELLAEGVDGLHFYTLNRSRATVKVATALNFGR
jgi:methylenetetrahydrofolate reductase (NADPH)